MQRIATSFLLSLALPVAALAADAPGMSTQQVYTFAVELDAEGRIDDLAAHGVQPGVNGDALAAEIRDWVFSPSDAGADASMRTFLRVVVDEAGAEGYRVVSATTGPALAAMTAPEYPMRDQLAGNEGMVVLRLDVAADGSVRGTDVHAATGSVSRAMAAAAEAAARSWRFSPEQVAGSAVASTMLWPVCYLGARSPASACSWTGPDTQRFSSKSVLPLDPNVTVSWTAAR